MGDVKEAIAIFPKELRAFLRGSLDMERPERVDPVNRNKPTGKNEQFKQGVYQRPSTPVSRLFLLFALTGLPVMGGVQLKTR